MKRTKPLIPFNWLPAAWGLRGKTREIAQAEYELSGIDLEERLLEINNRENQPELLILRLDLDLKNNKITQYDYDYKKTELNKHIDDKARLVALLDVDLAHKKLTQHEYDRKRADVLEEPWVSMPVINWDPAVSNRTYFQLDYNDYFVKFLAANGYDGEEEDVINKWLNDTCLSIVEEINDMDADLVTPTRRADTNKE